MEMSALVALQKRAAGVLAQPADVPLPSPCCSVCRVDEGRGWCVGCLRSLDEIAVWSTADDALRRAIWARVARRAEELTA